MHCKALKLPEFLRKTMFLPLLMDSTQLRAGSAGYTPPEKKQLKWLHYVSFQESKLYIGLYSHPHTPTGYPFFLPHSTAHRKENCGVSLSTWKPNCNKSKSLIFLPFRTLVSDFKSSPISQVDICQLTWCISQSKTPLEINHPTYQHVLSIPPFVLQESVQVRLLQDSTDVYRGPISVHSESPYNDIRKDPRLKDKAGVSNQKSAHLCPLCHMKCWVCPSILYLYNRSKAFYDYVWWWRWWWWRKTRRRRNHKAIPHQYIKWHNSNFIHLESESTLLSNPAPTRPPPKVVCCDPYKPAHVNIFGFYISGVIQYLYCYTN